MLAITERVANIFFIGTVIANTLVTRIGIVLSSIKQLGSLRAFLLYVCRYKDHSMVAKNAYFMEECNQRYAASTQCTGNCS